MLIFVLVHPNQDYYGDIGH